jgi:hypothetical protein
MLRQSGDSRREKGMKLSDKPPEIVLPGKRITVTGSGDRSLRGNVPEKDGLNTASRMIIPDCQIDQRLNKTIDLLFLVIGDHAS